MTSKFKSWPDWIALAVSITALTFSGLQWLEARQQRWLANETYINFDIDTDPSQRRLGISVRNIGPGVARIHSVALYLDGKPIGSVDDALNQSKLDADRNHGISIDVDDVMAAQEIIPVIDYRPRDKGERDRASDLFENHLGVAVNYCAMNGRCDVGCSTKRARGDSG
jgi:hypothetical protein